MNKAKKAFTLVELIVVITIIAILGTIAFISLQGYSSTSRDSVRISDTQNMKTALELFHLNAGKYPLPDDYATVQYIGENLFYQGTFGETVLKNVSRNMSEVPTDPLTDQEYIYSVSGNKNELEILNLMEGDDFAFSPLPNTPHTIFSPGEKGGYSLVPQTKAAGITVIPRIIGNYNGLFVKTLTYIVPLPSIINTEVDENTVTEITQLRIQSMVTNKGKNIPSNGNVVSNTGALTNLVLTGALNNLTKDSSPAQKKAVIDIIKSAYINETQLNTDGVIEYILNTPTDETTLASVFDTVVLNNATVASTTPTITETCSDGILNQDETGIDCGGTCGACPITCPTGYVLVPGNSTFSTSDFCVAKYEMKNVSNVAISQAAGTPWVSITQPSAITACNNLNNGDGTNNFHLITNNEWMTIARNIELNSENWADGNVGSLVSNNGGLFRGNVNLNDSVSCNSNVALDGNTPGTNCEVTSGGRNKRMHILSNGNEIWDLSGNVWEHVNRGNDITTIYTETEKFTGDGTICGASGNWYINGDPSNTCGETQGPINRAGGLYLGMGYVRNNTATTGKIFIRGGYWSAITTAGVFTLSIDVDSSYTNTAAGFRCAFSVN